MDSVEEFLLQTEVSKRNAAQISALDLLEKTARLNEAILDLVDTSELQPVLIIGVLETVKSVVQKRSWDCVPKIDGTRK